MLAIVLRGGDEGELARQRDSLLSRLLRVVLDVTPRTYAEGGREALSEPTWEPGPEHREAVQNKADDLASELAKVARGMEDDATALLEDVELARTRGVKFTDSAGRQQDPERFARLILDTHDAVIRNAGHLNAAASIGSPAVRVSDGGNPVRDGRNCEPCARINGEVWSLQYAALNPVEHPHCRRSFASMPPGYSGAVDKE